MKVSSSLLCVFNSRSQGQNPKVWTYYCQTVPKPGAQASPLLKRDSHLGGKALTFLPSVCTRSPCSWGWTSGSVEPREPGAGWRGFSCCPTSPSPCRLSPLLPGEESHRSAVMVYGDIMMVPNSDGACNCWSLSLEGDNVSKKKNKKNHRSMDWLSKNRKSIHWDANAEALKGETL